MYVLRSGHSRRLEGLRRPSLPRGSRNLRERRVSGAAPLRVARVTLAINLRSSHCAALLWSVARPLGRHSEQQAASCYGGGGKEGGKEEGDLSAASQREKVAIVRLAFTPFSRQKLGGVFS